MAEAYVEFASARPGRPQWFDGLFGRGRLRWSGALCAHGAATGTPRCLRRPGLPGGLGGGRACRSRPSSPSWRWWVCSRGGAGRARSGSALLVVVLARRRGRREPRARRHPVPLATRRASRAWRASPCALWSCRDPRDDRFGSWWRTALQVPLHPRDMHDQQRRVRAAARHRLDVWRMSTTPLDAPVIFFVHGGAWIFGDKREQGRPMLHEFVRRGWVAVACNYRLAPQVSRGPRRSRTSRGRSRWIKKYIATYGGDPERVVVAGGSAGGHLAALLALSANDPTWRPERRRGRRATGRCAAASPATGCSR